MKKLVSIIVIVSIGIGSVLAQKAAPKAKEAPKKETVGTKEEVKTNRASTIQPKSADQGKMKKDSTPDMRYKENKEAKKEEKSAGPMKKDGTPDMRHKTNKEAATKSEKK